MSSLSSFIQCLKLSKRIADNSKSTRAEVNKDVSNEYFDNLEKQIKIFHCRMSPTMTRPTVVMIPAVNRLLQGQKGTW